MKNTRSIMFPALAAVLSVAVLALVATEAFAVWQVANSTAYTAGQTKNPPPGFPGSTGLDGKFTPLPPDANGKRGVSFSVIGCCLGVVCAEPTPDEGVTVVVDIVVTTPNGPVATTQGDTCCPAECCELQVAIREATAGNWGGAATGVSVDVFVQCVCCGGGIEVGMDYYDYDTQNLNPQQ